ncbi:MAG: hypothetical protein IK032_05545 [Bacteroidales bacterium]|nr:hypothetical protein [Bacteroidales bacterium]
MKKTFRLLGLSALVLGLAVACNNNQPVEEVVDSVIEDSVVEEPIEEVTIDSALVTEEPEQPVVEKKKTTTTKKTDNKKSDAVATTTVSKTTTTTAPTTKKDLEIKSEPVQTQTKTNDVKKANNAPTTKFKDLN